MSPSRALERHAAGEIDLAPPTWVTLYQLSRHAPLSSLMKTLTEQTVRIYETHITTDEDGTRIALWSGMRVMSRWIQMRRGADIVF